MREHVRIPGIRELRGTLDTGPDEASAVVVACPPHPAHGGSRSDKRLQAVGEHLVAAGIDCLRFEYGPLDDDDVGEDVHDAIRWAHDRYETVGLFGYSFGAVQALQAAPGSGANAISALAPDAGAVDALGEIEPPVQIVYGERDDTVGWEPVVERARARDYRVEGLEAAHFFITRSEDVATLVTEFLAGEIL
jgi:hypothetical protein